MAHQTAGAEDGQGASAFPDCSWKPVSIMPPVMSDKIIRFPGLAPAAPAHSATPEIGADVLTEDQRKAVQLVSIVNNVCLFLRKR